MISSTLSHSSLDIQCSQQLQAAKQALESAEMESHPFRPSLNPVSAAIASSSSSRPLHERVGELQRDKNEYMMLLKAEVDKVNKDLTFNPAIPETSDAIARNRRHEEKREAVDIAERLLEEAEVCGCAFDQ